MPEFQDKLNQIYQQGIDRLPEVLTTLIIGLLLVELLIFLVAKVLRFSRLRPGLKKILKLLIRTFLLVVLFVAVLQSLGLNNIFVALTGSGVITALIISAGVAPLVTDVLAGLFLGNDREFQPGAKVRAGDKGTEGIIQTMDLRKVYVRDADGRDHVIPNSLVEKNEWVILKKASHSTKRRNRRTLKKSA